MCNCRNNLKGNIRHHFGRGPRNTDVKIRNHQTIDIPDPTPNPPIENQITPINDQEKSPEEILPN